MSTSTFYALVLIPIIVCYVALRKRTLRSQVPPTCRSPRKLPQNILALGIDHFWKTLKLRQQHRSLKTIADWHNTYGSTFIAKSIGKQIFHTWHPDNLKAIFGTKWKDWGTGRFQAMDPFCGRGFVTTDGEEWKGHRALLAPTLTEANAIDLDALNLAYNEYLAGLPVDGATVNLAPVFDELFLDLSLQFLFGRKLSSLRSTNSPSSLQLFQEAYNTSQFWMGIRIAFGPIGRVFSYFSSNWKQSYQIVHDFVDYYIGIALNEVSQQASDNLGSSKDPGFSLLQSLTLRKIDHLEIRSQIIQGMLVTQDTTGILLSNTVFLLSRSPKIWGCLREEIAGLGPVQDWDAQALKNSKLLHNIFKESLRLYPLFGSNGRVAVVDTVLPRGGGSDGLAPVFVPAGSSVRANFYTLHRQASIFGDDVGTFDPDRWEHISPESWEFMPFSHGPRSCAGRHKALGEASYIIARMTVQFESIEARDERVWMEDVKLVVKNLYGCKVALFAVREEERAVK